MAEAAFNLPSGQKAERKLEMLFVNVADSGTPEWELVGRGVEDASIEYNHDIEQGTDITGLNDTSVSPAKPAITMDPNNIRGGQKLNAKLLDIERRNAAAEFCMFEVLNVHCYLGSANGPFTAELHKNCAVVPTSLGGSSYVGMPLDIRLSNDKELGTVTIADGVPTFTKTSAAG